MSISVKFFASLRETLGKAEAVIEADEVRTAGDVWRLASGDRPVQDNLLVAINMDYARLDDAVKEGDEVAFFPPVTGG